MTADQINAVNLVLSKLNAANTSWRKIWDGELEKKMLAAFGPTQTRALEKVLYCSFELGRSMALDDILEKFYHEQVELIDSEIEAVKSRITHSPFEQAQARARLAELEQRLERSKKLEVKHHEAPRKIINHVSSGLRTGQFGKRQVKEERTKLLAREDII